ncbi:MAG: prolipoprotein diacylglyceryl transferase [SAR324 cluster bacterium]|nr:prolipoprotein diacylglyceryl transferase [SAR324 cluster bacterium]
MNPVLIDFGILQVRYYGLLYAISLYIAIIIVQREGRRHRLPLDDKQLSNFTLLIFLVSILGARLYYVLFNLDWYFRLGASWYEFLAVWHGGLAIHGGIIAGTIYIYFFAKKRKLSFLKIGDIIILPVMLGQAIGRIGNFMNGDAHGTPTDMAWGMIFPYGPASRQFPEIALHPVMLYESFLNFGAFFLLWFLRVKRFKPGFLSFLYIILYSVIRSFVSIFRADDLYLWSKLKNGSSGWFMATTPNLEWGIRAPHAISALGILLGIFFIVKFKLYQKQLSSTKTAFKPRLGKRNKAFKKNN